MRLNVYYPTHLLIHIVFAEIVVSVARRAIFRCARLLLDPRCGSLQTRVVAVDVVGVECSAADAAWRCGGRIWHLVPLTSSHAIAAAISRALCPSADSAKYCKA